MDWTRFAGSVISGLIGSFFSDSDSPSGEATPEIDFNPALAQQEPPPPEPEPLKVEAEGSAGMGMEVASKPPEKSVMDWFGSLSPQAQKALSQGVAGGVAGVMATLAARNAQEDAKEREDRAREDRKRRGAIPAISGAYSSRGIIGSRMG